MNTRVTMGSKSVPSDLLHSTPLGQNASLMAAQFVIENCSPCLGDPLPKWSLCSTFLVVTPVGLRWQQQLLCVWREKRVQFSVLAGQLGTGNWAQGAAPDALEL